MISKEMIKDAADFIIDQWGSAGSKIVDSCKTIKQFNGSSGDFLDHCIACGGNWSGMLLSGIKELYPDIWDLIPDNMGKFSWPCLCNVLILCGVDTSV